MRTRRFASALIAVGAVALVGAVVAVAATSTGWSTTPWRMMGPGFAYVPAKPTPVHTLGAARTEAQKFAGRLGVRVDEVLQFKRNYYAKLVTAGGAGATEVLVDPDSGAVWIEYGPAMMWNIRYGIGHAGATMMGQYGRSMMGGSGMMGGNGSHGSAGMMGGSGSNPDGSGGMMGGSGSGGMMGGSGYGGSSSTTTVSMKRAHTLAQRWLDRNERGVKVESGGDAFPGYYTLETLRDGRITGMISVNSRTGAVWPHWWHGAFIAKSE